MTVTFRLRVRNINEAGQPNRRKTSRDCVWCALRAQPRKRNSGAAVQELAETESASVGSNVFQGCPITTHFQYDIKCRFQRVPLESATFQ